ncbi:DNA primase [Roseibium sp.]|uniref:DNA primase n=1 Tax=Roseibium sp. TaxID=1936156 RepID=UPI003A981FDF
MRFDNRLLDDIRARLTLSDLVGRRVSWDRRKTQPGKGDYWACCPFHEEKSPSFHVDDRRNRYKCFGCGASGDHFRFVMETEGLSFPETVERLAEQAGVAMPAPDPQAARREHKRASLVDVCELAARYFQEQLAGQRGVEARTYVNKRGLTPQTLSEFRFGLAPDSRDGLKKYLLEKNVPEEMIIEAGLAIKPEGGRPSYDRFRGRLMIPIQDERGRVVAFGGRTLLPDGQPKYLNSPETPLFHKGVMLFNAHRAREPAYKSGRAVVVEGYLDAIALHQAGVHEVVASLGTAFTEDQILRLWKFAPEPIVCFDGDAAGVSAAHRAIDRILPVLSSGHSFQFSFLPDGMDPDDLIKEKGLAGFEAELAGAQSLFEAVWEREVSVARLDTPERKAALEKRFGELTGAIKDPLVRRGYQLDIKFKLSNLFFQAARAQRQFGVTGGNGGGKQGYGQNKSFGQGKPYGTGQAVGGSHLPGGGRVQVPLGPHHGTERMICGLCLKYPYLLDQHLERVAGIGFSDQLHARFRDVLCRMADPAQALSAEAALREFDEPLQQLLAEVTEVSAEDGRARPTGFSALVQRFPLLKNDPPEDFVEAVFLHFLDVLELKRLEKVLEEEMQAAEADLDETGWLRIQGLSQDLNRSREECAREEGELAERGKKLRQKPAAAAPMQQPVNSASRAQASSHGGHNVHAATVGHPSDVQQGRAVAPAGEYPGDYSGDYPEAYSGDYPADQYGDYAGDYPAEYFPDYQEEGAAPRPNASGEGDTKSNESVGPAFADIPPPF